MSLVNEMGGERDVLINEINNIRNEFYKKIYEYNNKLVNYYIIDFLRLKFADNSDIINKLATMKFIDIFDEVKNYDSYELRKHFFIDCENSDGIRLRAQIFGGGLDGYDYSFYLDGKTICKDGEQINEVNKKYIKF